MGSLIRHWLILAALAVAVTPFAMHVASVEPLMAAEGPTTTTTSTPTPTTTTTTTPSTTPTPTPTPTPSSTPTTRPTTQPTTTINGADSSGHSIDGLAGQRFSQMITTQVLGSVLLGVNEQVNCNDCVSAFGSAGSFSAGVHGRKNLTSNLSLLGGIAYTQYGENGYYVTSAPIGAFALRYDFTDWGSSRPFFDIGTVLSPWQDVRYRRTYMTSLGPVSLESRTRSEDYGVYGRAGWIARVTPRDEIAGSIEIWQLWQRVRGYSDPTGFFNPFNASIADGTDRTNLFKIGGQWTHLFGTSFETNLNGRFVQSFANRSGIVATVTGDGMVVPTIGNQGWFEYGARIGYRITSNMTADAFVNGTFGALPVGNTIHGGVGLRINY